MCFHDYDKRLVARNGTNIRQVENYVVVQKKILICVGTNRLVLEFFPDQSIEWSFWVMEKWKMFGTNRLVLSDNRLYCLSILKKMKFLQSQSIDIGLQSIAWTYWLWNLEIRSAVNQLTLSINRLILCILWKTGMWDKPID